MYTWEDDLSTAFELVSISDRICLENFKHITEGENKADGTPVTNVDKEIESMFLSTLEKKRPGENIISEETRHDIQSNKLLSGRTWIIDPLDHTRHFIRGNPEYGTLIALTINNKPYMGVISAPSMGFRWWSVLGQGAWVNDTKMSVSNISSLKDAYFGIAGHREWHTQYKWDLVSNLLSNVSYPFGTAGGFLPSMMVASGVLDAFIEPWGYLWDHAAISAIIVEAGGMASTLDGSLPKGGSLLVSNNKLHKQILSYFIDKS